MMIMYFANGDYFNVITYLQTACVIMIRVIIQPYKSHLLSAMDTVILLTLLAVNLIILSQSSVTVIIVVLPCCSLGTYLLFKNYGLMQWLHLNARKDENNQNVKIYLPHTLKFALHTM